MNILKILYRNMYTTSWIHANFEFTIRAIIHKCKEKYWLIIVSSKSQSVKILHKYFEQKIQQAAKINKRKRTRKLCAPLASTKHTASVEYLHCTTLPIATRYHRHTDHCWLAWLNSCRWSTSRLFRLICRIYLA